MKTLNKSFFENEIARLFFKTSSSIWSSFSWHWLNFHVNDQKHPKMYLYSKYIEWSASERKKFHTSCTIKIITKIWINRSELFFYRILHQIPHNFCIKRFLFRRTERWENIHRKWRKFLPLEWCLHFCVHAAYIRIDSSQGRLAHTLARLPDTRKSTSDLISPILARYDLKKKKLFSHDSWTVIRAQRG